jgi:hypothetical protein
VPNSVSILHDLLPISIDMTKKERKGVYNFTNPGAASHNEVLALYKKVHLPTQHTGVPCCPLLTVGLVQSAVHQARLRVEELLDRGAGQDPQGRPFQQYAGTCSTFRVTLKCR